MQFVSPLCFLLGAIFVDGNNSLLRQTDSGPVQGFQLYSRGSTINAWRGIPYATAPIGDLRWEPSVNPESWVEPLDCTGFGSQCVQPDGNGDEDCLFLNVYSNANASTPEPYPVLFYIHGGSLMGGNGNGDMSGFVSKAGGGEGVVLVQINYRLNIFGYLAAEVLSTSSQRGTSGNYGFLDQIHALKWVQRNIANFGGDASRVTIMGQSSGGTSVFALMASPLSTGLFHAAISLSGSPNVTMGIIQAYAQNKDIILSSGCGQDPASPAESVVKCLKSLPSNKLVQLIPASWNTPGLWNLPVSPQGQAYAGLPVVDGIVLRYGFGEALRKGVMDVPLLLGNMAEECDVGPEQDVSQCTLEEWKSLLESSFAQWGSTVGADVYELYEAQAIQDPQLAFDQIVTDYGITCASAAIARQALASSTSRFSSPLYIFYNSWALSRALSTDSGYAINYAFHGLDMLAATDNLHEADGGTYIPSSHDEQMSRKLREMFFEFMSTNGRNVSGLSPVDSALLWPEEYAMFVISGDDVGKDSAGSMQVNFRSEKCLYFEKNGITGEAFWWVN
jgi:carboxylesterase 2